MAIACVASLIEALAQSPLLEAAQQRELDALSARHPEPRALARELIHRGWLTAYQVNQLFLGRAADLALGPYVLLERLGEGGMGQVFKARHRSLGRLAALKVVREDYLAHPNALPRFQREIQAASQLDHPNVVRALDADQAGGIYYFAMEYIEGTDLCRLVKERGPLPVLQACDYVRQTALGLQHAFERGLVHRDIKPANLLVARPDGPSGSRSSTHLPRPFKAAYRWGVVKILDMGLARSLARPDGTASTMLTQVGSVMGTPDYIAPEQARNSRASDIRSDLYSLGCTLYFLLAGRPPFPTGTLTEKLLQHQLDEPEPVGRARRERLSEGHPVPAELTRCEANLEIPEEVAQLVRRLMAKRPEKRYQTPAELAAALADLAGRLEKRRPSRARLKPTEKTLADGAIVARPPTPPSPPGDAADSEVVLAPARPHQAAPARHVPRLDLARNLRLGPGTRGLLVWCGLVLLLVLSSHAHHPAEMRCPAHAERAADPAEAAWAQLLCHRARDGKDADAWRARLVALRAAFPGTPQSGTAADWLARLPSPFDRLGPAAIPGNERRLGFAVDLVAVLGEPQPFLSAPVQCVAVSPDGGEVARAGADTLVRRWRLNPLRELPPLRGHQARVDRLAYAPDGRTLASASQDGVIALWDVSAGKALKLWEAHPLPVSGLAFTPDGRAMASGSWDGTVKLWDARTASHLRTFPGRGENRVLSLALSPDGRLLACGHEDHTVRLWDLTQLQDRPCAVYRGHTSWVKVVAFAPDGRTLVSGGGGDGTLKLCTWDGRAFRDGPVLHGHRDVMHGVAFTSDGKTLASAGEDRGVRVWDVATGRRVREWADLGSPVNGVAFAPDRRHLVTANANGTAYVLRLAGKAPARRPRPSGGI
jgi:serine/threonine-protein kinase